MQGHAQSSPSADAKMEIRGWQTTRADDKLKRHLESRLRATLPELESESDDSNSASSSDSCGSDASDLEIDDDDGDEAEAEAEAEADVDLTYDISSDDVVDAIDRFCLLCSQSVGDAAAANQKLNGCDLEGRMKYIILMHMHDLLPTGVLSAASDRPSRFKADPRFRLLSTAMCLRKDSHATPMDTFHIARREFAEVLGHKQNPDDMPTERVDQMDGFALGLALNVHPKIFTGNTGLLQFCRSRIKHNNIKSISVMLQRAWRASKQHQASGSPLPPTFDTGFAFTRYEVAKLCKSLTPQELDEITHKLGWFRPSTRESRVCRPTDSEIIEHARSMKYLPFAITHTSEGQPRVEFVC